LRGSFIRQGLAHLQYGSRLCPAGTSMRFASTWKAIQYGQISETVINYSLRANKSSRVRVIWPCWEWISWPERRALCSYAESLSLRASRQLRTVDPVAVVPCVVIAGDVFLLLRRTKCEKRALKRPRPGWTGSPARWRRPTRVRAANVLLRRSPQREGARYRSARKGVCDTGTVQVIVDTA